jgi:mercuric ion binding protein
MKTPIGAGLISVLLASGPALAAPRTVTLAVEGMTCISCPYQVQAALRKVEGVTGIDVSFADATAIVIFDDARTDVSALTRATADAGFPSSVQADAGAAQ